jgi:hypothetical protein
MILPLAPLLYTTASTRSNGVQCHRVPLLSPQLPVTPSTDQKGAPEVSLPFARATAAIVVCRILKERRDA